MTIHDKIIHTISRRRPELDCGQIQAIREVVEDCIIQGTAPEAFPAPPADDTWHNPAGLTPEQVGVRDGWRLLLSSEQEEAWRARMTGTAGVKGLVQRWRIPGEWTGFASDGAFSDCTYRTKLPLPEPAAAAASIGPYPEPVPASEQVPLTADDIPPVCWLRENEAMRHELVTSVKSNVVETPYHQLMFTELKEYGWEYSADRKTWKPCHKPA